MFKFHCPHCGQRISAQDSDAGTIGICPGCRADVPVPTPQSAPDSGITLPTPRSRTGSALVALALCGAPIAAMIVVNFMPGMRSIAVPVALLGGSGLAAIAGIVFAIVLLFRSRGMIATKVISILSILVGLGMLAWLGLALFFLITLEAAMRQSLEPIPDFKAPGGDEVIVQPTPSPTPRK
jgi:hypothetical protein